MGVVVNLFDHVQDVWDYSAELAVKELICSVAHLPWRLARENWRDMKGAEREAILEAMRRIRICGDVCRDALR